MAQFIQIDEDGYFSSSGLRVSDEAYGLSLISHLFARNRGYYTQVQGNEVIVEAFDEPLVAHHVTKSKGGALTLSFAYGFTCKFDVQTLCTDEWDRFHGRTLHGLPFVLSRTAQMELFNIVDEFDDESLTFNGTRFEVQTLNQLDQMTLLGPQNELATKGAVNQADYWSDRYRSWQAENVPPGWELGEPAKPLREVLPQIKIPRSRICVLGCGTGHDAAYFASQGHIVTGVDFSPLAIEKARAQYTECANLKFVTADAFHFAKEQRGQFDVIFEHTFYCAIDPARRSEVLRSWRSLLADGGHLLGIFFILDRVGGPPYGASEWELRELLKNDFEFLYWTRWKTSIESRLGRELVIYARKK
jgi:SAM-dependent methyltransferase